MAIADPGQHSMSHYEMDLRRREVEAEEKDVKEFRPREVVAAEKNVSSQLRSIVVQALALIIAMCAAAAAVWGAWQATRAVNSAQQNAARQATEDRLATAISAIGEQSSATQVAGLTLLRRAIASQMQLAATPADKQDAYSAYATSLDIIAVYLHGTTKPGKAPQLQGIYAADELKLLLAMATDVEAISNGRQPAIDLSSVGLSGVSWPRVNFGWLGAAFMPGIDLSYTNLTDSSWGNATLRHADFRCADLQGADLRGADLRKADLRGANLSGAKLPPAAQLQDAKTQGIYGQPPGLQVVDPAHTWSFGSCKVS
jgi:uncharacterized protein YjbI with pentapeptide repeats